MLFEKQAWMVPLQILSGAVDKKQLKPILSMVLVRFNENAVYLTATDLDIELTARLPLTEAATLPAITLPAKRLFDLMRVLDDQAQFEISLRDQQVWIQAASTLFKCSTLPVDTFPLMKEASAPVQFSVERVLFIQLLQATAFAISQQDARTFLNGLLIELDGSTLRAVAADGHRMALKVEKHAQQLPLTRFVLPRKSVYELLRLLTSIEDPSIHVCLDPQVLRVQSAQYTFSSKLMDTPHFPYQQAIPLHASTRVSLDRDSLKRALMRVLIIMSDKNRPTVMEVGSEGVTFLAQNQEQEQVVEQVKASVEGEMIRIGVNPHYVLDVLAIFQEGPVRLSFSAPDKGILIDALQDKSYQYILMPMKLS